MAIVLESFEDLELEEVEEAGEAPAEDVVIISVETAVGMVVLLAALAPGATPVLDDGGEPVTQTLSSEESH